MVAGKLVFHWEGPVHRIIISPGKSHRGRGCLGGVGATVSLLPVVRELLEKGAGVNEAPL